MKRLGTSAVYYWASQRKCLFFNDKVFLFYTGKILLIIIMFGNASLAFSNIDVVVALTPHRTTTKNKPSFDTLHSYLEYTYVYMYSIKYYSINNLKKTNSRVYSRRRVCFQFSLYIRIRHSDLGKIPFRSISNIINKKSIQNTYLNNL